MLLPWNDTNHFIYISLAKEKKKRWLNQGMDTRKWESLNVISNLSSFHFCPCPFNHSHSFSNTLSLLLSQGLCTCYAFSLGQFSSRYLHHWLHHFSQISAQIFFSINKVETFPFTYLQNSLPLTPVFSPSDIFVIS